MPNNCGRISANILLNCDYPIVGGVEDRLILINKADWDNATLVRDGSNPQIIESIALETSPARYAYEVEGKNNSIDVKSTLVKARYSEGYSHEIIYRVFNISPAIKEQIEAKAKGRLVAITQNNFKGATGNAAFEIHGMDIGLELVEAESNKSDAETQGAYVLTLRTPENFKESHLPATLFDTDFATTKAVVDGLLN
jgi:hypothetical protein